MQRAPISRRIRAINWGRRKSVGLQRTSTIAPALHRHHKGWRSLPRLGSLGRSRATVRPSRRPPSHRGPVASLRAAATTPHAIRAASYTPFGCHSASVHATGAIADTGKQDTPAAWASARARAAPPGATPGKGSCAERGERGEDPARLPILGAVGIRSGLAHRVDGQRPPTVALSRGRRGHQRGVTKASQTAARDIAPAWRRTRRRHAGSATVSPFF
jgi:hypothetical protein